MKRYLFLLFSILFLSSCGEGVLTVDDNNYEPKIVIEAYLYPNKPVQNIRITRNLSLNRSIDPRGIILSEATASITDLDRDARVYPLSFNPDSGYFEYNNSDLQIRYGGLYRLDVAAVIDGQSLQASSTSRVPLNGFHIDGARSTPHIVFGRNQKPRIQFSRSEQTDFYAFSIVALEPEIDNFIFDIHPYGGNIEEKDVVEFIDEFTYSHYAVFNTPLIADNQEWVIEWFHTWFYSRYRIIGYAGDKNLKDFYLTHANVQEFDGNLHEPAFHIDGDGIGVFASAITDTFYLEIAAE